MSPTLVDKVITCLAREHGCATAAVNLLAALVADGHVPSPAVCESVVDSAVNNVYNTASRPKESSLRPQTGISLRRGVQKQGQYCSPKSDFFDTACRPSAPSTTLPATLAVSASVHPPSSPNVSLGILAGSVCTVEAMQPHLDTSFFTPQMMALDSLQTLGHALEICAHIHIPLGILTDRALEATVTVLLLQGDSMDIYTSACRIASLCIALATEPLSLFHRSRSISARDLRYSILLSSIARQATTPLLTAALQRAVLDRASLLPYALADCLAEIAAQGLTDQLQAMLSAAQLQAAPPSLITQLFVSCRGRGDLHTAVSLMETVERLGIGHEQDR